MRTAGLALLALVALVIALVTFVLATAPGARVALQLFAPAELEVQHVEGRLWGDLQMQGIRWAHERADVTIAELAVRWTPGGLLDRAVVVDDLRAAGVTVRLRAPAPEDPDPEAALPELELPVRVRIDSAVVTDVALHPAPPPAGGEALLQDPLRLERLGLRADIGRDGSVALTADAGAPEAQPGLGVEARFQGRLLARGAYPMELRLEWEARPGDEPALAGEGTVQGDLTLLALAHTLREPVAASLEAEVRDLLDRRAWRAELQLPRFRLAEVRREWPAHAAEVRLEASGVRDRARGTAAARLHPEEGGEVTAFASGSYAEDRVALDSLVLGAPPAEGRLTATGEVFLGAERPHFRLAGRWSDLAWPPEPGTAWAARRAARGSGANGTGPEVQSPAGDFRLEGTTARYRLAVRARVEGRDVPTGEWSLEGVGDSTTLVVSELRGETLEGELRGSGRLSWSPAPAWRFALAGEGLRPELFAPRWPGELDFTLRATGETRDGVQQVTLELDELTGTLRGEPLTTVLRLGLAGQRVDVDTAWVRYGDATLHARGAVGNRWGVAWLIDVPDLALFAADTLRPELAGRVEAEGAVTGARRAPEAVVALRAEGLETPDLRVDDVVARGTVDLSGDSPSHLQLAATGLRTDRGPEGGLALDDLILRGEGRPGDHRITVAGRRAEDHFRAVAAGGLVGAEPGDPATARAWAGRVEDFTLEADGSAWRLREPAALEAGPDMARLDAICWEQVEGVSTAERASVEPGEDARPGRRPGLRPGERPHACLSGHWARATGARGELDVAGVPIELFAPLMPAEFEGTGALALRAEGEVGPDGRARGTGSLRLGPGRLIYRPGPGLRTERAYEVVSLDLEALGGMLEAALQVAMRDGEAEGRLRVPLEAEAGARPLEGRLAARFDDRGLLGALSLELEETQGLLEADLTFSGTTEAPRAAGRLSLTEGAASVHTLGIRLRDVELEAESETDDRWRIAGSMRSGDGELDADGSATLTTADQPWAVDVAITGERFEAYNTADGWLAASPDLRAQGSPDGLLFTGSVLLPFGRITPEDLQLLAIQPSQDVVLVGPGTEEPDLVEEPPLPVPIRAEVELVAGDSLLLDAMGVEGRLVGSLQVSYAPDRPTTATGELDVVEGTYTAYHQELVIERGRLVFPDIPLTNPGLDIRVSREPQDGIRVGLDVRGTARAPDATLFSEPLMPEAEALSWLLLGRSLTGADPEEGELLASAARTAGFAGGELLAGRLAAAFGLEEARVERDPEGGAFILGAQLAPNLYVAYTIGLFEAADVLNIRYEFGRWTLTTQTGFETAADILYRAGGEELPAPELVPDLGADTIGGEATRNGGSRP